GASRVSPGREPAWCCPPAGRTGRCRCPAWRSPRTADGGRRTLRAMAPPLVSLDDVRAAGERLRDVVVPTPLVSASTPPADRPLAVTPESLQPAGAFNLRGAYTAVASIPEARRAAGVVTHSSGNHGRALAWA